MNSTYAQKSSPVQKAADTKAASVLDSSAQSESLQRKAVRVSSFSQGTAIQMAGGEFTRGGDFQGNNGTPVIRINPKRLESLLENVKNSRGDLGRKAKMLLNQGGVILAGIHEGGIGDQERGADPATHITVRSRGHAYHIKINKKGVVYKITG